jgi:hypothetical protein
MLDDDRIPCVESVRILFLACRRVLETYHVAQPNVQSEFDKIILVLTVPQIELITTQAPHFVGGGATTRGWTGGMHSALEKLRLTAKAIMARWKLTRHADLPPYPGDPDNPAVRAGEPLPKFPLKIKESELEVISRATEILKYNLGEIPPPIQLSTDQEIGRFLYARYVKKMHEKDIVTKLSAEHPSWKAELTNEKGKLISRQARRKRAEQYQAANPGLPPIPPRTNRSI